MDPAELHSDYVRDRFNNILQEAARQRELPSLRQRVANKFRALATWLEPEAKAFRADSEQIPKRA